MYKKFFYCTFCSLLFILLFTSPSNANDSINIKRLNNLIYDTITEEGSFDNLDVNVSGCNQPYCLRSVSINADDIYISADGVFIKSAKARTLTSPINLVKKNNYIMSTKPLTLDAGVVLTQENINKSLSQKLNKYLKDLKINLGNGNDMYISFLNPFVGISNDKLKASARLYIKGTPEYFQIPVNLETKINIVDKKVVLKDLVIYGVNIQSLAEALKKQHIVLYDLRKLEEKNRIKIKSSTINISDNKIKAKGSIVIPAYSKKYGLKISP